MDKDELNMLGTSEMSGDQALTLLQKVNVYMMENFDKIMSGIDFDAFKYVPTAYFNSENTEKTLAKINQDQGGSASHFKEEMDFLIKVFLEKGPGIVDSRRHHEVPEGARLSKLISKYGIVPRLTPGTRETAITLSRIASCFPIKVLDCMVANPNMDRLVPVSKMEEKGFYGFRPEFRTSAWFNLIPVRGIFTGFIKLLLYYQFEEAKIINARNAEYLKKTDENQMIVTIHRAKATFDSDSIPREKRQELLLKYAGEISEEAMKQWSDNFDRMFDSTLLYRYADSFYQRSS